MHASPHQDGSIPAQTVDRHDRRRFLEQTVLLGRGSVLAGLAATATATARDDESDHDFRKGAIDAHVHVWTDDVKEYPLAEGYRPESMRPATFPPEELFRHCRPCGVSRIVLIQMSFYGFDNRYMLDVIRKHPGAFAGVAVIDPDAPAAIERMKSLHEKGVRGFRLHPGKLDDRGYERWFENRRIRAMWQAGAATGQAMCLLINPGALPHVDRMCDRHPDTKVVIDHMARIGMDGKIVPADVDNLCRCARHKNVYVKVSAFYALGEKRPPYTDLAGLIGRLVEAFGTERLMWASDCPFQVFPGHTYAASIDLVRERLSFLSDVDRDWLLRRTAERVFFAS